MLLIVQPDYSGFHFKEVLCDGHDIVETSLPFRSAIYLTKLLLF